MNKYYAARNIIAELNAQDYFDNPEYSEKKKILAAMGVGGFCVFRGELEKTKQMLVELQDIAEDRLLICADFEYGLPMRIIDGGTAFPHAMALGRNSDYMETYKNARLIGRECKAIGVHWNFAPVCDINNNPDNPIINIRSFGEDKETVSLHSSAYIKGLQDERVLACAKHFPGHGDTSTDSHMEMPVLEFGRERIDETESYPFKKAIENGAKSIMIGHLSVPALDSTGTSASLSYDIITNYLRGDLGFDGLIVTDALRMDSISKTYNSIQASESALRAGANVALMPENEIEAIEGLTGISETDPDFLELLKQNSEMLEKELEWAQDDQDLRVNHRIEPIHEKIALGSAFKATEVLNKANLPLDGESQIAAFAFLQAELDMPKASTFFHLLQQAYGGEVDFAFLDENIGREDLLELKLGINDAEYIIAAYFYKSMESVNHLGDYSKLEPIITRLAEGRPIVHIAFGNPYLLKELGLENVILTYSDSLASQAAAILQITGRDVESLTK
jgi:beta-glucosidase-like glycosyl hydrolase